MSFSSFLRDCTVEEKADVTHVICASGDEVRAAYVRPPYRMDTLRLFFSMTKSIASLAIGIAWDQGILSLDERLCDIFRDEWPEHPYPNAEKITVRHLLTMSGGMDENTYGELFGKPDWVRAYLAQEFPHEPGTHYRYSTHGSHMLSAIISKKTGFSLADFLDENLFRPLGILEAQWEHSPEGLIAGGMGLSLYPMSLVKIAQLLLNKGMYEGRRLISEEYLSMATQPQIVKQDDRGKLECEYDGWEYGFQFHIGKRGHYRMDGAFGQVCLICPENNLAVIAFSGCSKTEILLRLIYEHLMDGDMDAPTPDEENTACAKAGEEIAIPCGTWRFDENAGGLKSIRIERNAGGYCMSADDMHGANKISFSPEKETSGYARFVKDLEIRGQEYVCRAAWSDALEIEVYYIETPYIARYRMEFGDDEIRLWWSVNVSFTLKGYSCAGWKTE